MRWKQGFALAAIVVLAGWVLTEGYAMAASKDLGKGFSDHGVAAPTMRSRGAAATVDGQGRNVILVYPADFRGCMSMLVIDVQTGQSEQFDAPEHASDSPFAIILSSKNRFYTHFGGTFMEFDPAKRAFTFSGKTKDRVAMSMTEDHLGRVWAATYPASHVVCYDPATNKLMDSGSLNKENWPQYPRSMAVDKAGWAYIGIGNTYSHLVAYNPADKKIVPLATKAERIKGSGYVIMGKDGKVYGRPNGKSEWFELYEGKRVRSAGAKMPAAAPIRTGAQEYVQTQFPDGSRILELNVPERYVDVHENKTKKVRRIAFDYQTEGPHVVSLMPGPEGKRVYGTTGHPLRLYCYDPETDAFTNHGLLQRPGVWHNGHWNAVAGMSGKLYGGMYGGGILWEYDPQKPWVDTDQPSPNPHILARSAPAINRPHELLAHSDGQTLILAGTPGYGLTGGGMLIHNVQTGKHEILNHTQLLENQATLCLEEVSETLLVGGTTVEPGTGGEKLAKQAELYLFDLPGRKVVWREAILPGAQQIRDLKIAPNGLVFGLADGPTLFVFDPAKRKVVHKKKVSGYGALSGGQAPRALVVGPDKNLYAYFQEAIVRIDPDTFELAQVVRSPVPIQIGIALIKGRFYFVSGSHICSYEAKELK